MVQALLAELDLRKDWHSYPIDSIYFGGGTPSILSVNQLGDLLTKIRTNFTIHPHAEITLEANPDDITAENLELWFALGINRLSLGVQSFADSDLQLMNRAHNAKQSHKALQEIGQSPFENYTCDFIYGNIGSNQPMWQQNVEQILSYKPPHISAYALTVEPNTQLAHQIVSGKWPQVDEGLQHQQFLFLRDQLLQVGYEHYEVSNFALPGYKSKHNSAYWSRQPYLGIGPSAHSYFPEQRSWNISNNQRYMQAIETGQVPEEIEKLTDQEVFNEMIMTGLRTKKGVYLPYLLSKLPQDQTAQWQRTLESLITQNQLIMKENYLQLHENAIFFADGISMQLFIV